MRIWIDKAGKAERKEKGRRRKRRNNPDGTKLVGRSRAGVGEIMLGGLRFRKDGLDVSGLTRLAPFGGARGWKYLKMFG